MNHGLSAEEQAQIYQTIEMFEVITQSQNDDYQSLEILKEAYAKLGRTEDAMRVSKMLVEAYCSHGQYASALMECEGILQREPNSPDIVAILGDLEGRLHLGGAPAPSPPPVLPQYFNTNTIPMPSIPEVPASAHLIPMPAGYSRDGNGYENARPTISMPTLSDGETGQVSGPNGHLVVPEESAVATIPLDYGAFSGGASGGLVENTAQCSPAAAAKRFRLEDDGSEILARQLVQLGFVAAHIVQPILERVVEFNRSNDGMRMGASLLVELSRAGHLKLEDVLSDFVARARLAYVPLENYDVDRQTVKTLPPELSLHRLIMPFDVISRTLLVAISNPVDSAGKSAVEQSVDLHVHWYLASPEAIMQHLATANRINPTILGA